MCFRERKEGEMKEKRHFMLFVQNAKYTNTLTGQTVNILSHNVMEKMADYDMHTPVKDYLTNELEILSHRQCLEYGCSVSFPFDSF